jgi:hypothetical protein
MEGYLWDDMKKPPCGDSSTLALHGLSTSELSDWLKDTIFHQNKQHFVRISTVFIEKRNIFHIR